MGPNLGGLTLGAVAGSLWLGVLQIEQDTLFKKKQKQKQMAKNISSRVEMKAAVHLPNEALA